MSHKKRSKKRKRSKHGAAVVCTRCKTTVDTRPTALLVALADTLTACEQVGVSISLKHGVVYTKYGYVLPTRDDGWVARTLVYTEFNDNNVDPMDE